MAFRLLTIALTHLVPPAPTYRSTASVTRGVASQSSRCSLPSLTHTLTHSLTHTLTQTQDRSIRMWDLRKGGMAMRVRLDVGASSLDAHPSQPTVAAGVFSTVVEYTDHTMFTMP